MQVMLTVNAYHLQEQGIAVKLVSPRTTPASSASTMAVMAGTKRADAAHQFINMVLSEEIQSQLVESLRAGPVTWASGAAKLRGQPGISTTPAEWKDRGYIMNDEARPRRCRRGGSGHREYRQEVRLLLAPALGVLAIFAVELGALLQYSVVGSSGTAADRRAHARQLPLGHLAAVPRLRLGHRRLTLATTALTLVASYPVAYALARAPSRAVRSWLLVLTLAPFFTGGSCGHMRGSWCGQYGGHVADPAALHGARAS